ncbi:Phage terminase large subunit [Caloramator mitchellensis]|uniref:Phage terminase large subunit n=2 Tax=Caloramator mitchellensis TaxID=908809 RepID=A0A0R3JYL5_CALMK|nr:Phage terminase large subunit [Caloramator mitchellensis]
MKIKLSELIAPSFYEIHNDIKNNRYTHYWLKGGRGSTKSSFVSIEIILGIMKDPKANAVVLRKVKETLKDSVFEQLVWAIEKLQVSEYWDIKHNPMELTYIPTGQKILFRGADKPKKIKSTKVSKGYIKFIWYEEVDEFNGIEEIRMINQSLMRGGEKFVVFYTYNPPNSVRSWVNEEVLIDREDRKVHHSTYLTVPKAWLGEQFFIEAEHLKKVNEKAYRHEYLGEVTGTGGEIFTNVTARKITDEEIKIFDRIKRGIDFGYAGDPFHYTVCHFDKTRRRLYIFYEIHQAGLSNRKAAELIKKENVSNRWITADSAEPKSIDELKEYGLRVKGAKKGPDSVEYGIKFLQDLEEIIIDPERCPNTLREFLNYELEKDKEGNFKADYPDKNNHSIDAVRYALEDDMLSRKPIISKPQGW